MRAKTDGGNKPRKKDRCYVIAEVAQAHDGSLGMAHAYIDAVARTGCDAVKFQTHLASAESTPNEPWRVKFSRQDESRYDYWQRVEFAEDEWVELKQHAEDVGLQFLSSPFSKEAVRLLRKLDVGAWKIPSGEVNNLPLLESVARDGKPVLLSSGMSSMAELDQAVAIFKKRGVTPTVLQCTSVYPCPPEKIGLNLLGELRNRYACPVGLSDHSGTIYAGLAAATLGIDALEVHVTMSREMFGPDVPASVTTRELEQLVHGVRFIEKAAAHRLDKDEQSHELEPIRSIFRKSVVAARDLTAGTRLAQDDLALKKPGDGIPPEHLDSLPGRRLTRDVRADQQLQRDDLEVST